LWWVTSELTKEDSLLSCGGVGKPDEPPLERFGFPSGRGAPQEERKPEVKEDLIIQRWREKAINSHSDGGHQTRKKRKSQSVLRPARRGA